MTFLIVNFISSIVDSTIIKMVELECNFCEKIITGTTEQQAKYLLLQHKISKHRDKIKIEEINEKEETE